MQADIVKIKDLYVGAFLYAQNKELLKTEKEDRFYWFIFSGKQECEQLSDLYWSRKASVDPKAFTDAIKTLKDLIYSQA